MWQFFYLKIFRRLIWSDTYIFVKVMSALLLMIALFTAVFYIYEDNVTLWDSLWTAYVSLTTVGYGDFAAKSWQGRVVTVLVTFLGIGSMALFAGSVIENIIDKRLKKMRGEKDYRGEQHIIVINIPSYDEIFELLNEIDACREFSNIPKVLISSHLPDNDKVIPEKMMKRMDAFIRGIPSSMETLNRANMKKAKACILLGDVSSPTLDDVNTLTAGIIEKNWPQVKTILDCSRSDTLNNLKHFGIDGGVNSTLLQMGLLVQELKAPGTFDVYSELSTNAMGQQIYISENPFSLWDVPESGMLMGQLKKAVLSLNLPVTIIGVKKSEGKGMALNPSNDYIIQGNDRIIYLSGKRFDWLSRASEIRQRCRGEKASKE